MNEFYIPANFEEGGKIMGVFGVRNIIGSCHIKLSQKNKKMRLLFTKKVLSNRLL